MHSGISVRPVDARTRDAVLALRVHPSQLARVGHVADLLADASVCPGCEPMAIVQQATVIGYCRVELHAAAVLGRGGAHPVLDSALGLRAFFLDRAHQGAGRGRRAVLALCRHLARRHADRDHLVLTVGARNHAAVGCYLHAGFENAGTLYHGADAEPQLLMRRRLRTVRRHP